MRPASWRLTISYRIGAWWYGARLWLSGLLLAGSDALVGEEAPTPPNRRAKPEGGC